MRKKRERRWLSVLAILLWTAVPAQAQELTPEEERWLRFDEEQAEYEASRIGDFGGWEYRQQTKGSEIHAYDGKLTHIIRRGGDLSSHAVEVTLSDKTITRLGGCVWNDSSFTRTLIWQVDLFVGQPGATKSIRSVSFVKNIGGERMRCESKSVTPVRVDDTAWLAITYLPMSGDNLFLWVPVSQQGTVHNMLNADGSNWVKLNTGNFSAVRGLGLFVDTSSGGGGGGGGGSNPDPDPDPGPGETDLPPLKLSGTIANRFEVWSAYRLAPSGSTGSMRYQGLTSDTAALYFTNANNLEVFTKVLNGCGINDRYWVFVAGLTDQQIDLEIRDRTTGEKIRISNPAGSTFQPRTLTTGGLPCQ